MPEQESTNRWLIGGLCGAALAVGLWIAMAPVAPPDDLMLEGETTRVSDRGSGKTEASESARALVDPDLPRAHHKISESGRLTIDSASFGDADELNLSLELAKDARGDSPLSVRIVSVDGRVLDTSAQARNNTDDSVQIGVDKNWLQPGRYMIQIKTAEKTALPLRRYVLEIK